MLKNLRQFSSSRVILAGHSKWANIKHKKAANDAVKSAQTFRMARQIQVYAKIGGGDITQNAMLANVIDKAKSMSIPKKVIESAIKRGTGELKSTEKMETVIYEGLAPGGVAVILECITDNKNRSLGYIRPVFNKFNLNMTPTAYMFERKGLLVLDIGRKELDDVFENLLDAGCEDIEPIENEDSNKPGVTELSDDEKPGNLVEIITDPKDVGKIANQFKNEFPIKEMNIGYLPQEDLMVEITDEDTLVSYEKFMSLLDEIEDVSQVYTNLKG